jgi:NADPH-dependent curcumin reductase CurA
VLSRELADINRQWLLRRRPRGNVQLADFEYRESEIPDKNSLRPGELLLRNRVFLCAPTMRNWMDAPGNSFYPSLAIGEPVLAPAACEVIASAREQVPVGTRVTSTTSWQDYQRVGAAHPVTPIADGLSFVEAMSVYGLNARTAYFGLLKVGRPKPGETLVVSGAAGSTGSAAAQIGKIMSCRVIGIAGGADKCDWLTKVCGLDAAIDYRLGRVQERLAELCPNGIDIFYDNVGGEILQAAVENMARFGRIVLCGQIASYTQGGPAPGPTNMMRIIYGGITMQGFLQSNYADEADAAITQLRQWVAAGKIVHREDVRTGFKNIPETFATLFDGRNQGTLLAVLD